MQETKIKRIKEKPIKKIECETLVQASDASDAIGTGRYVCSVSLFGVESEDPIIYDNVHSVGAVTENASVALRGNNYLCP